MEPSPCGVRGRGPRPSLIGEVCDGFILQLADPYLVEWTTKYVKNAASAAGRNPDDVKIWCCCPAYVGDDIAHQRDQVRWFGGMVGNHVADLVARMEPTRQWCPRHFRVHQGAPGLRLLAPRQGGQSSTDFVPDEVVDRFCVLGPIEDHIRRMEELRDLGVDQFASLPCTTPRKQPRRLWLVGDPGAELSRPRIGGGSAPSG